MRRFFPKNMPKDDGIITIDGDEYFHLNKVLRVTSGEKVICSYGDGIEHVCEILNITKNCAVAKILKSEKSDKTAKVDVTLFQGMIKGDKFEFVVQKMVELGLKHVVPFESEYSVAKCDEDKTERIQRIAKEACKQCGRSDELEVCKKISFETLLDLLTKYDMVIFAFEHETTNVLPSSISPNKKVALIIGSEGGFSEKEVEKLVKKENVECVTLGKRILRAETASVALASVVMFLAGEWK